MINKTFGKVIPASRVVHQQRRHFLAWTVIPLIGSLAAVLLATYYSSSVSKFWACLGMWVVTGGLGISVGFHRHFTHRAFETDSWLRLLMAVCGSMAAQGSLFYWVSVHRRHHEQSDKQGDPHSPKPITTNNEDVKRRVFAFWHGHMGWVVAHDVPIPSFYAKDLVRNRSLEFVNRTYQFWMIVGVLIPGIVVGLVDHSPFGFLEGTLWGGFVRIFIGNQIIWSINSVCHTFGTQEYDTGDSSRNNSWLAIPAFGEGWHNNHHAFPHSANFGLKRWQLDLGYTAIFLMEKIGLVHGVRRANTSQGL